MANRRFTRWRIIAGAAPAIAAAPMAGLVAAGSVPGPVIRATEGDILEVEFTNAGSHPHTIHFHGIHPSGMDGVFEIVEPAGAFTYRFPARPYGMHLYLGSGWVVGGFLAGITLMYLTGLLVG